MLNANGYYIGIIGYILGLYRIMENRMETTI